jgi:hypothetical protein
MVVLASQPTGSYSLANPQAVPVSATTVNSTNPNNFGVNVTVTNSVSAATISSISINNVQVATVGGGTYVLPGNGTIKCTYASGTTTYVTAGNPGLTPIYTGQYPFTDPIFQQYTAQQNLQVSGVAPFSTDA